MAVLFNMTTGAHGPELIVDSVNVYLNQFDPLYILLVSIVITTTTYLFFPRVNYVVVTAILSTVCVELFRAYQRDLNMMTDTTFAWYSVGGSLCAALLTFYAGRILF